MFRAILQRIAHLHLPIMRTKSHMPRARPWLWLVIMRGRDRIGVSAIRHQELIWKGQDFGNHAKARLALPFRDACAFWLFVHSGKQGDLHWSMRSIEDTQSYFGALAQQKAQNKKTSTCVNLMTPQKLGAALPDSGTFCFFFLAIRLGCTGCRGADLHRQSYLNVRSTHYTLGRVSNHSAWQLETRCNNSAGLMCYATQGLVQFSQASATMVGV
mmetsp:Transcript_132956/g.231078  ORF Transcript_132956/g.231078 Transcript_132956/m.231078 type:complete len:214 (-) Transcript_132956:49-690(-)